ncbi:unnamed protein product [Fraxinus pennsylvanica]|uniref:Uncharacterized protein n=1 Tax=Fraxinus pennsylvanica TaxID=56036 RepID=A0AAD1ZH28_9LAMI|nr:unnamed protein product [Fraxinus pennsylvanica]
MSDFGLDPETGRIIADVVTWEDFITGKPDFGKWRTKLCPRYDEIETIFGNDAATGDRPVSVFDHFSPINDDLCDEDNYSSDDDVNLEHVDALEDDTPNAPISFTANAAWSSNRDTMADEMWAAYHPSHDMGIDFD